MEKFDQRAYLQEVGRLVEKHRKEQKLSQRQLAFEAATSESAIRRIEKGSVDMKATTIARLAVALHISPAKLMPEVD